MAQAASLNAAKPAEPTLAACTKIISAKIPDEMDVAGLAWNSEYICSHLPYCHVVALLNISFLHQNDQISGYHHLSHLFTFPTMSFQYPEKLNKDLLRIFTLEPGEEKDALDGSLETHCLDAAPEYEAVSCEWGERLKQGS